MDANLKNRGEQLRILLRALTGPGVLLPGDAEEAEIAALIELKDYFTDLAHHRFVATEDDFNRNLAQAEAILLRKLKPEPWPTLRRSMLCCGRRLMPISETAVQRALELIRKNPANYSYFFAQLKDPEWIAPLRATGRFKYPPAAIRRAGSIAFPPWPEGDYLVRMAAEQPQLVRDVVLEVPVSDNARVHEYAFEAALEMLPGYAAEVARREAKWVEDQVSLYALLPQRIAAVVNHLASGGEVNAALALAQAVLRISESRADRVNRRDNTGWHPPADPVPKLAMWEYDSFLKECGPVLLTEKPHEMFRFLCNQLDHAMKVHRGERAGEDAEDFSSIWRPDIEYGNLHDFKETLVVGARDAALMLSASRSGLELVLAEIRRHRWRIFRRLEHFILGASPLVGSADVAGELKRSENFQSRHTNREFHALLMLWLPKAPPNFRRRCSLSSGRAPTTAFTGVGSKLREKHPKRSKNTCQA